MEKLQGHLHRFDSVKFRLPRGLKKKLSIM